MERILVDAIDVAGDPLLCGISSEERRRSQMPPAESFTSFSARVLVRPNRLTHEFCPGPSLREFRTQAKNSGWLPS